jgi:hypothetical protein
MDSLPWRNLSIKTSVLSQSHRAQKTTLAPQSQARVQTQEISPVQNFMHILAIRSKDDHLFARFIWARRLKYAVVWPPALLLAS